MKKTISILLLFTASIANAESPIATATSTAVSPEIETKARQVISVTDAPFNADATGVADATSAFQAALNSVGGGAGGRVKAIGKFRVSRPLTIPAGVTLEGDCGMPGSQGNNASSPYGNMRCGVLMIDSSATITMSSGSGLKSIIAYRNGMKFPAPDSSAFSGTAITAAGDDVSIDHVLVMGFAKGFYSWNWQRTRIEYFYGDNVNGIEIGRSYDIAYVSHCHQWPFATIASGGAYTNHIRSGKAYYLHDVADWAKISDSFSWGYYRGFHVANANSVTLLNVGADNAFSSTPLYSGSMGIVIEGTSHDTRVIGAQTAAQATAGIYVNTAPGMITTILGHNAWGGSTHGIWIASGDAVISGSVYRQIANGITETNANSRITVSGSRFHDISGNPVNPSTESSLIFLGENDYGNFTGTVGNSKMTTQNLASAASLVLPNSGNLFTVTGTTAIKSISGGWAGREVTLIFTDPLTLTSTTGSANSVRLASDKNFTTASGSSLMLHHNGHQWYETARAQ